MTLIVDALNNLAPNTAWTIVEDNYDNIEWFSDPQLKPSKESVDAEIAKLKAQYEANLYKEKRAAEYPPITDYLDGIVKGDQAQIDKYIADCQAVKAKYPKGS